MNHLRPALVEWWNLYQAAKEMGVGPWVLLNASPTLIIWQAYALLFRAAESEAHAEILARNKQ